MMSNINQFNIILGFLSLTGGVETLCLKERGYF